ncbi:peptide chain release factor N(5)-glutamine methyltransferase [Pseudoalteromonas sp. G4]|uniref:peptide chain release factor N(5)-glutamine methyltransferase n=1 Tax=Pseudoalteromonas sp. G4 TaxID=2992761 RepID=UPI00237D730F|nr:peptide chain release factor N(5)-glutamine methyltransferase [Pseudoalteromonas sp. G4]MDE3270547.1 peptide chain release factor N(5)-glutamine methyltransferase [Pseudoalteromonas sp. G4]
MSNYSLEQALAFGASALNTTSESPKLDAEVLLLATINQSRTYLFTWPEKELTDDQQSHFIAAIEKRKLGKPVAHITQCREFWSLNFKVSPATLIPRPDTETLVELALTKATEKTGKLLDLGTGTGAIALSLASELVNWQVTAVDFKPEAVELATENKHALQIENAEILQSDWFNALSDSQFDIIVSNPPYIDPQDPHLQQGDVRFEPLSALVAKKQGMADIEHIIKASRKYLKAKGWLLIEHGYDQGQLVRDFFAKMAYKVITTEKDLGGNDRVTLAKWDPD